MKYRINYYSKKRIMHDRIHIMDPRTSGTNTANETKDLTVECYETIRNNFQFVVPWQLT